MRLPGFLREPARRVVRRLPGLFKHWPIVLDTVRHVVAGRQQIVVIGGHGGEAYDDNSRAVARFYARDPGYKVFWIYERKSVRKAVKNRKIVLLKRGSPRAELITMTAHLVAYSHGISDITRIPQKDYPWRKVLYLGHGCWGFKRIERRAGSEAQKLFDYTIAVSEEERQIKSQVLGISPDRVFPVGLPKHDSFVRARDVNSPQKMPIILYAPTWRDWLQHKPSDRAVELHFSGLAQLLSGCPIKDELGKNYRLIYLLHKNIRGLKTKAQDYAGNYDVEVKSSHDVDVNALLRSAKYLITDYSGVFWDFIMQDKTAARFLYDESIYNALVGTYPSIDEKAARATFRQSEALWNFLLSEEGSVVCGDIAQSVAPYSDGRSCEKLALEMDKSAVGRV